MKVETKIKPKTKKGRKNSSNIGTKVKKKKRTTKSYYLTDKYRAHLVYLPIEDKFEVVRLAFKQGTTQMAVVQAAVRELIERKKMGIDQIALEMGKTEMEVMQIAISEFIEKHKKEVG